MCALCSTGTRTLNTREMYEEAVRLREICRNALFLINDRIDIAPGCRCRWCPPGTIGYALQCSQEDAGPEKIIGITVHNLAEALEAQRFGADYLGVSPIFQTATKPDAGKPAGIALIEKIRAHVDIPLIAIGGINLANAPEVIRAGADGLCAISAVVTKEDVGQEIRKFQELFLP